MKISIAASWLGIGRGSDLVFYCAILLGLLSCFHFYRRYRALEIIVTELVRLSAIGGPKDGAAVQETAEPSEMSREGPRWHDLRAMPDARLVSAGKTER